MLLLSIKMHHRRLLLFINLIKTRSRSYNHHSLLRYLQKKYDVCQSLQTMLHMCGKDSKRWRKTVEPVMKFYEEVEEVIHHRRESLVMLERQIVDKGRWRK